MSTRDPGPDSHIGATDSPSLAEAFPIVAIGARDDIEQLCARSSGSVRVFLQGVIARYDGDIDGSIRLFRRLLLKARGTERAIVADMLAPLLVMRGDIDGVRVLTADFEAAGWRAVGASFRAVCAAYAEDRALAMREVAAACAALESEDDELVRMRVLQRLALAAVLVHRYGEALNFALSSASICERRHAWRTAGACYSIGHAVHLGCTGNFEEALRFAVLLRKAAEKSRDESLLQGALIAEFEIVFHLGDLDRTKELDETIKRRSLPVQFRESFSYIIIQALVAGTADPVAMRTLLQVLLSLPGLARGEWALSMGLIAVADAAVGDDDAARRHAREAISHLGRFSSREPAHEHFHRRLARGCCAAALILLGDAVRAERLVDVSEVPAGDGVRRVPDLVRHAAWSDFARPLRGVARVIETAKTLRQQGAAPGDLTPSEFELLKLYGDGWGASRIALATDRSVNTVYAHTKSILRKLDAARAPEAVAIARERGLLK